MCNIKKFERVNCPRVKHGDPSRELFPTFEDALEVSIVRDREFPDKLSTMRFCPDCGGWHITTKSETLGIRHTSNGEIFVGTLVSSLDEISKNELIKTVEERLRKVKLSYRYKNILGGTFLMDCDLKHLRMIACNEKKGLLPNELTRSEEFEILQFCQEEIASFFYEKKEKFLEIMKELDSETNFKLRGQFVVAASRIINEVRDMAPIYTDVINVFEEELSRHKTLKRK